MLPLRDIPQAYIFLAQNIGLMQYLTVVIGGSTWYNQKIVNACRE